MKASFLLPLETLCKRDSPTKTRGEATSYSRTSTGVGRQRAASSGSDTKDGAKHRRQVWRPLLLFIPLRLGLSEMNSVYNEPFKVCRLSDLSSYS